MTRWLLLFLLLTACGKDNDRPRSQPQPQHAASSWDLGPTIDGWNRSQGSTANGNIITIPAGSSLHYVTRSGSLGGKSVIRLRFSIDAPMMAKAAPHMPATLALYFQRATDNWSAKGKYEAFRWYSTFAYATLDHAGEYEVVAPLEGNWTAVMTSSRENNFEAFDAAVGNTDRIGFVLGGGTGWGHGALGPATLTIISFDVN